MLQARNNQVALTKTSIFQNHNNQSKIINQNCIALLIQHLLDLHLRNIFILLKVNFILMKFMKRIIRKYQQEPLALEENPTRIKRISTIVEIGIKPSWNNLSSKTTKITPTPNLLREWSLLVLINLVLTNKTPLNCHQYTSRGKKI